MIDIVERARKSADACEYTERSKLLRELADEIERLRLALDMIEGELKNSHIEIERLHFELKAKCHEIEIADAQIEWLQTERKLAEKAK